MKLIKGEKGKKIKGKERGNYNGGKDERVRDGRDIDTKERLGVERRGRRIKKGKKW